MEIAVYVPRKGPGGNREQRIEAAKKALTLSYDRVRYVRSEVRDEGLWRVTYDVLLRVGESLTAKPRVRRTDRPTSHRRERRKYALAQRKAAKKEAA